MIHNIPQPDFEAIVAEALANDPNVEVRKNMSYVSCSQVGERRFLERLQ